MAYTCCLSSFSCSRSGSGGGSLCACVAHLSQACPASSCQQADYKSHRKFCKAYTALQRFPSTIDLESVEPTDDMDALCVRTHTQVVRRLVMLEDSLGRSMSKSERMLVSGAPRCLAWYVALRYMRVAN